MKKTNKPVPKAPAKKAPATKQSTAKPKTKSAAKHKPRKVSGQAELMQVVARLEAVADKLTQTVEPVAQTAERLAQATERLVTAAVPTPQPVEQPEEEYPRIPAETAADHDND
jgi:hypothetical protein